MNPMNTPAKFDVRSFTHSWDNIIIIGVLQKFGQSMDTPSLPFLGWTLCTYLPNLKFVALRVPEIIGVLKKNLGRLWIRLCSLFSKIFHGLVFGWSPWTYLPNLKSLALAVPEIIAIAVLGWGCVPPNLREGEAVVGRGWYRLWLPIGSP